MWRKDCMRIKFIPGPIGITQASISTGRYVPRRSRVSIKKHESNSNRRMSCTKWIAHCSDAIPCRDMGQFYYYLHNGPAYTARSISKRMCLVAWPAGAPVAGRFGNLLLDVPKSADTRNKSLSNYTIIVY